MKKIKSIIMLLTLLLLGGNSLIAFAAAERFEDFEYSVDYNYATERDEITLKRYLGDDTVVVLPSVINGLPVTETVDTFSGNSNITEVILPESLRSIGEYTFYECSQLTSITIPESVIKICDYAFAYSGIQRLSLSETTRFIGEGSFYGCKDLTVVDAQNTHLVLMDYSFAESGLRVLVSLYKPIADDNAFPPDMRRISDSESAFLFENGFLYGFFKYISGLNLFSRFILESFVVVILFATLLLIALVVRKIIRLFFDRSPQDAYLQHKRKFAEIINTPAPHKIVCYEPIILLRERITKIIIGIFFAYLGLLFLMWLIFAVGNISHKTYDSFREMINSLVPSVLKTVGITLAILILLVIALALVLFLWKIIAQHMKTTTRPHVRITRIPQRRER